ncbi:uncharacterized protein A4U43_C07F5120 [Asparagus officinalis]|uniref:KIB1-4 beta-propeller domain-containing protein n=1 Tax=Asparagus officinalis TaxID=4686 RepID=A0A5P1E9K3_ASPOF|nr:uncharacterized protein LOC109850491 [Asparagus officinalis]ONK62538.1 uncharacterized protein A4U43_C07F5120 [Asparagus officinalis]
MTGYLYMRAKTFGSHLFAALFPNLGDIFLCGLGESSWRRIQGHHYDSATDFVYHDGRLYVRSCNEITVFDPRTLEKLGGVYVRSDSVRDYLVESPQGELLLVGRKYKSDCKRFKVFWLDSSDEKIVSVELTSIGDNVLFVDEVQAMAFSAGDLEGCRWNCIYFVDGLGEEGDKGLMLFDIEKGQVEHAPLFTFTSEECGRWGRATLAGPSLDY